MYKSILFNLYHDPLRSFKVVCTADRAGRDKIHITIDFDGYLHSRTACMIYFSLKLAKRLNSSKLFK